MMPDRLMKLQLVETISDKTVRRGLEKTTDDFSNKTVDYEVVPFCFIVATFESPKLPIRRTFTIQNLKSKIQNPKWYCYWQTRIRVTLIRPDCSKLRMILPSDCVCQRISCCAFKLHRVGSRGSRGTRGPHVSEAGRSPVGIRGSRGSRGSKCL